MSFNNAIDQRAFKTLSQSTGPLKARRITPGITNAAASPLGRIVVLTGARQTGKTTLAKQLFPGFTYLSIEDPVMVVSYTRLTAAQWKQLYPEAILDEIQKEPVLIESIKSVYDQWPEPRYVLLGSSQLLLMSKVRESLAGRCVIIDLYPLTLPELQTKDFQDVVPNSYFQDALLRTFEPRDTDKPLFDQGAFPPSFLLDKRMPEKQQAWQHYLTYGGYPALTEASMTDEQRFQWLHQYIRTYLERDVRDLTAFRDLEPFIKLQQALAVQTGQVINASTLANHTGVSVKTVQRYIQYLDMSYQTLTLPAWSRNATKQLTKAPKIHYLDNGVLQAVLQKRGGITGAEFESLVIAELYKQTKVLQVAARYHHLRIQGGREIDLLIELTSGYLAFEIKQTDKVTKTDARHFNDLESILDKPLLHSFIISNDPMTSPFSENVTAINAACFLG